MDCGVLHFGVVVPKDVRPYPLLLVLDCVTRLSRVPSLSTGAFGGKNGGRTGFGKRRKRGKLIMKFFRTLKSFGNY